jgi:hypothetical protein
MVPLFSLITNHFLVVKIERAAIYFKPVTKVLAFSLQSFTPSACDLHNSAQNYGIKMASAHDNLEKGLVVDRDSGFEEKGISQQIDDPPITTTRSFAAPEFIRNMTPEEREQVEGRLRRKIDLRLLPMIILMYILNYLDRVSNQQHTLNIMILMVAEQHRSCQVRISLEIHSCSRNIPEEEMLILLLSRLCGIVDDLDLKGVEFQVRLLVLQLAFVH